ncbi:hypothetical protein CCM_04574 [Cordyceps militaris CM01]|uniref:Uncharacterized protein n=1 Tax=Cordyceps militaris (strain CM01) TaxID=983644 RepID=G3JFW8_CORMM|nr:uncharacterized protein CCM_04574 [Cordyceps militaris CM01]EGX93202.1 hypothetical protein CCM_04574 [Cordyceps militaris CM01]
MAAEQLSGAQGIRSLTNHDAVFHAFDSYPWTKDKAFLSGLHAILGDPNSPNQQGSPADMAVHARIFYYSQRVGVSIDFAAYQAWLAAQPDHTAPNILPPEYLASSSTNGAAAAAPVLDWQKAAPKADLYVDRAAAAAAAGDQPAYPMAFAEMIKLLQEGKEVPGIRQIPNTIIRDPAVKPVGARTAPRKPWEKDIPSPSDDAYRLAALDTEFPPVDTLSEQPEPEAV